MEAFKLYKNLADNYNMPEAQCKVAEYYYKRYIDIDEKESKEKAFLYYEKAAGQENTEACLLYTSPEDQCGSPGERSGFHPSLLPEADGSSEKSCVQGHVCVWLSETGV